MVKKLHMALLGLALILGISGTAIYALTEVSVKNYFYTVVGRDTYIIAAAHSGLVTATGK